MVSILKIVSWNVNGIRAAWNHGLSSFLDLDVAVSAHDKNHKATADSVLSYCGPADIYAFQETKVDVAYSPAEIEGYHAFWSFCEGKKGYSGTLCLTRWNPIAISYDFTVPGISKIEKVDPEGKEFSTEGRIITLEYESFYFVNCYFPNSQASKVRYDYRVEWDERLVHYLMKLKARKPTIVCGDFNVAITDPFIFPENKWIEKNAEGFQATEREQLRRLITVGFTDAYRYRHPEEREVFSWWSNRLKKRDENKGWRLDYFLVSDALKEEIKEATMLTAIHGSDHCPVYLEIDIQMTEIPLTRKKKVIHRHNLNEALERSFLDTEERRRLLSEIQRNDLSVLWDNINWELVEENVRQMQQALAKSAYGRSISLITKWQKRIVYSIDAKLLAVRHVCSTNGGAGIDGIKWITSHDKMSAALALTSKDYKAQPSRLLLIKSKTGKTRRIHLETWNDRAMQALYAMSLDPVAESWADRKSFAFRKGRSAFDLNEYVKLAFSSPNMSCSHGMNLPVPSSIPPEWAFIGDVRQCYEHISHEWIYENIPMAKKVLKEFLGAGYMFGGKLFPMDEGIGIGLGLSPIIANMTLDGLQEYIYDELNGPDDRALVSSTADTTIFTSKKRPIDYGNGNLIRYADDIIITARTREDAVKMGVILKEFLAVRGLELSSQKSRIVNIYEGFDYMSRFYIRQNKHIYSFPSDTAIQRFMGSLKETVMDHTGSQLSLIQKLNRKLNGWATYHKVEDSYEAFQRIDIYLKALLLELCEKKHPKWDRAKILERYWIQRPDGQYQYSLPDKREIRVNFLCDTILVQHRPVKTNMNPYIETNYVDSRSEQKAIDTMTGLYRSIWNRQDGKCYFCGKPILKDQEKYLAEINPYARSRAGRYAYVHSYCMDASLEFLETDTLPITETDVMGLLEYLDSRKRPAALTWFQLSEFFRLSTKNSITITFDEIEEILGKKLGKISNQKEYWYRTGFDNISQCWLQNGYEIRRLDLTKRKITFMLVEKGTGGLIIPDRLIKSRIPDEAKYELENYFNYIIKKYGIS